MRLVFTVGDGPSFSIGRFIPNESGRSSTKPPRKWFVWGECHRFPHVIGDYTQASQIVLVEDLISAHKLSQVVPCICLFGTTIFDACIPALRHIGLPITMWLDKDQEGSMAKKCERLSFLTNQEVSYVVTASDPKCLSFTKIKEVLNEH